MTIMGGSIRAIALAAALGIAAPIALSSHSAVASPPAHSSAAPSGADASALTCKQAKRRTKVALRRLKQAKRAFAKARKSGRSAAKRKAAKRLARTKKVYRRAKKQQATACKAAGQPSTPSVNHPPEIRNPLVHYDFDATGDRQGCNLVYGGYEGVYCSTFAVFIDLHPAIDPDGDPLSYAWTASTGEIKSVPPGGLHAEWYRPIHTFEIFKGLLQEYVDTGTVYITVSDGRGGMAQTEIPPKELAFSFPTGGI